MPNGYPPSSFEQAVGSFLNSYSLVSGIKSQRKQDRIREREAQDASNLRKAQLADGGYVSQDLTVPDTTDRNWLQGVGHAMFGSEPEHREALLKIGPSAAERAASSERDFTTGRDTAHFQNERDIEQLKAGIAAANERTRQAGEDRRAAANNRTSIAVAGIDHAVQAQAQSQNERQRFFDDAVSAAGGDAVQAMSNVGRFQMPLARKFGATRTDYHAAAARYRDSKAMLTRETLQTREEIAAARSGTQILPRDLNGKPIPPPAPAAATKSANTSTPQGSPNATPNVMAPFASFPPEQQKAIAEAGRRIRAGKATLEDAKRAFPAAVFSAVAGLRVLSAEEKSQARKDPQFRAFLQNLGYDDSEL